jgi:hypothetical protein
MSLFSGELQYHNYLQYLNKAKRWKGESWVSGAGKTFFNPIVDLKNPANTNNIMKLRVTGSDCPVEASINARTIRPIWTE